MFKKIYKLLTLSLVIATLAIGSVTVYAQDGNVQETEVTTVEEKVEESAIGKESEEIDSSEVNEAQMNLVQDEVIHEETKENTESVEIAATSVLGSAVSLFNVTSNGDKYSYYSGQSITANVTLAVSDDHGSLAETIIEIKVPKKHITSFEASDFNSMLEKVMTSDPDYYYYTYKVKTLTAGTAISFPVIFNTHNGNTPNGFDVPFEITLKNSGGTELVPPVVQNYEIITKPMSITKEIKQDSGSYGSANNVTVTGGKLDLIDSSKLSATLSDLKDVEFRFLGKSESGGPGQRYYSSSIIEDTLPDGAVFNTADNPGWELISGSPRKVRYEISHYNSTTYSYASYVGGVSLKLKFPNHTVVENISNSVDAQFIPDNKVDDEIIRIASDDITFKLKGEVPKVPTGTITASKRASPWNFNDISTDRNRDVVWTHRITNGANISDFPDQKLRDVVFLDDGLNSIYQFKSISLPSKQSLLGTDKKVTVEVKYTDGSVISFNDELSETQNTVYQFERLADITSVEVKFVGDTYINPGNSFSFAITTELKDKVNPVLSEDQSSNSYYNYTKVSGFYSNASTGSSQTVRDYVRFTKAMPRIAIAKSSPNSSGDTLINTEVPYTLTLRGQNIIPGVHKFENSKIVDFLPDGFEYVPESTRFTTNNLNVKFESNQQLINEPKIIANYKDTGKTALIWELPTFSPLREYISISTDAQVYFNIDYKTKITAFAEEGRNTNTAYFSWQENDIITPLTGSSKDIYDLNGNGSKDDNISSSSVTVNYVPPREVIVRKEVKGGLDSNYHLSPSYGLGEIGTKFTYRFTLFNNSVLPITNLNVLDMFAHVGDKTISTDTQTNPHSRVDRGSTFKTTLTGPIVTPTGFKIQYTLDSPDFENSQDFYENAAWLDSVEDYSLVTGFKVTLDSGYVFEKGSKVIFDVEFEIPKDTSLTEEDQSVNTFGTAISSNLNFFESNTSTIKITRYKVEGNVFDDFDENGFFDKETEYVFKNHTVTLLHENGDIAVDLDGNPIQVQTDENGFYSMDVFRNGTYKIKVTTPDGYSITTKESGNLASHIGLNNETDTFTLDKNNKTAIKNAGFYKELSSINIKKDIFTADDESFLNDTKFDFVVKINDELYKGKALKMNQVDNTKEEIQIADGKTQISSKESILIEGVEKNASVNIVELETQGYVASEPEITVNVDATDYTITFVNTVVVDKTEITINKEWVGGPDIKPTIQVQLYRNGDLFGDAITLENGVTSYTWTNLDKTDSKGVAYNYTVDEVEVPENYIKSVDEMTITNTYESPKTEVTVNKEWVGGPDIKPTIQVQLYRNGDLFGDAITLENGVISYTWTNLDKTDSRGVAYSYTVDEIKVPENYKKEVNGYTITNTFVEIPGKPKEPDSPRPPVSPEEPGMPNTGVGNESMQLSFLMIAVGSLMLVGNSKKRKKV